MAKKKTELTEDLKTVRELRTKVDTALTVLRAGLEKLKSDGSCKNYELKIGGDGSILVSFEEPSDVFKQKLVAMGGRAENKAIVIDSDNVELKKMGVEASNGAAEKPKNTVDAPIETPENLTEAQAFKERLKAIIYEKLQIPQGKNMAGESQILSSIAIIPKAGNTFRVLLEESAYKVGLDSFRGKEDQIYMIKEMKKVLDQSLRSFNPEKNQRQADYLDANAINQLLERLQKIQNPKNEYANIENSVQPGSY